MIGVPGRFVAAFQVNGTDICDLDSFVEFTLQEESGGPPPTFTLIFNTSDDTVLSSLNEGNVINAGIGVSEIDWSGLNLRVLKKRVLRATGQQLQVQLSGSYDCIDYMMNGQVKISQKTSAIENMISIVSQHFIPDFSLSSSNDSMKWIQHGISDAKMVQNLWTHADVGSDSGVFPMIAITADGIFRHRISTDIVNSTPSWIFSCQDTSPNAIPFAPDYVIESDTGISNYWQAYSKATDIVDITQGLGSIFNSSVSQFLGISSSLEQQSGISSIAASVLKTVNHHDTYHQSHANNVANLASASSNKLILNAPEKFFLIRPLDMAIFKDDIDPSTQAYESYSGQWVVSKVIRSIRNWKFNTNVTMCRESMNNVQSSS